MSVVTNPKYNGITLSPIILAQGGIPMVLPSSGTIGNNGALSALTALPTTYAGAYMYFPVGKIAAGVAAGLYWVVPSSTTAGTIYNNTYTSGIPAAPASPTAFATTGPGAYTQTTAADITLVSNTIPGELMGANGALRMSDLRSMNNTAGGKTLRAQFDGSNYYSLAGANFSSSSTLRTIRNRGSLALNMWGPTGALIDGTISTGATVFAAINTAVDKAITITAQIAVATDYIILEAFTIEVLPS